MTSKHQGKYDFSIHDPFKYYPAASMSKSLTIFLGKHASFLCNTRLIIECKIQCNLLQLTSGDSLRRRCFSFRINFRNFWWHWHHISLSVSVCLLLQLYAYLQLETTGILDDTRVVMLMWPVVTMSLLSMVRNDIYVQYCNNIKVLCM